MQTSQNEYCQITLTIIVLLCVNVLCFVLFFPFAIYLFKTQFQKLECQFQINAP